MKKLTLAKLKKKLFRFQNKKYRADVIKEYMQQWGYDKAVCFSCGNASRALKECGVNVLDISPAGQLLANEWFEIGRVKYYFKEYFDATSGHIPLDCLLLVAEKFKQELKELPPIVYLPTGSGETLVELKLAFPDVEVVAVYNLDNATKYDKESPMNKIVELLAEDIIYADELFNM